MSLNLPNRSAQCGFTLVEVLIAFLIIVIGLLGVLALQNKSLQYNHIAFLDSQAQLLITDIVERIRANPQQASAYQFALTDTVPTPTTDCSTTACTSVQIKTWDLAQWLGRVKSQTYLPGAKAAVSYNSTNRRISVSIQYSLAAVNEAETQGETPYRTVIVTTRVF